MGKLKLKRPQNLSLNSIKNLISKETWSKIQLRATKMFGMDYRSMALFRVAMALCVIGDVIERATDLRVMYSEYGVMPRHLVVSRYSSNYFVPIHLVNTSVHFQAFLFALHIVFAFLMLIGYRTKLFSILTWFMTISLQAYVGVVGHGGDVFFRMMLFINIFIPTAQYFSVDNATFYTDPINKSPLNNRRSSLTNINNHGSSLNNNSISIAAINLSDPDPSLLSPLQQQQLLQQQLQQDQQSILQQSQQQLLQQQQQQQLQQSQQQPPLSPLQIQQQQEQSLLLDKNTNNGETGIDMMNNESNLHGEYKSMSAKRDPDSYRYLSFGTACILLQMGLMYVTSYFHKSGAEWHTGEATFYAITLDYFATDMAKFLLNFRTPLRLLTIAVAKWELFGIFFMISPIFTDWLRMFGALGFIAMHAGFVMCLRLGLFFFVTACAQLINIPTTVWEIFFNWTDKKILKGQRPTRVYYNTSSPISQKIALALKTFFIIPGHAVFSPLDHMINHEESINTVAYSLTSSSNDYSGGSDEDENVERSHRRRGTNVYNGANGATNQNHNGLINSGSTNSVFSKKDLVGDDWLVTIDSNGIRKRNIHALNYICSKSPLLMPFALAFTYVPANVCNIFTQVMQFVHSRSQQSQVMSGGKRSLYQKRKNPVPPSPRVFTIMNGIWMAFICYFLLAYNCNTFKIDLGYKYEWNQFAYMFRLDQGWNMFSPSPPKTHWWHVIHGVLDDGTPVELFKDEGLFKFEINTVVNFDKPNPFYKSYGNHRWFKYWENGYNQANSDALRLEMGRYICREFNSRHFGDEMLYKFSVYFVHEFQNLDGTVSKSSHSNLWSHICYEKLTEDH